MTTFTLKVGRKTFTYEIVRILDGVTGYEVIEAYRVRKDGVSYGKLQRLMRNKETGYIF